MDAQEFNEYLMNVFTYQGQMNTMATSTDLMLGFILEKINIEEGVIASPVVVDGRVLIRGDRHLVCLW